MTNEEMYKTVDERQRAFKEYCLGHPCKGCKYAKETSDSYSHCIFAWLADETSKEAAPRRIGMKFKSKIPTGQKFSTWREYAELMHLLAQEALGFCLVMSDGDEIDYQETFARIANVWLDIAENDSMIGETK